MSVYVGVTKLRFVQCVQVKGRTYYYFRRRPFPIVRIPGELGSELFTSVYKAALQAGTRKQFTRLRSHMPQRRMRSVDSPLTTAIVKWAIREPITYWEANMVSKRFGVAIEDIVRGREIVDGQKNEVLAVH